MPADTPPLPELLTGALIRQHVLPVARRTFQRYLAAGVFPPPDMRLGGKGLWRRSVVLAWLAEHAPAHESDGVTR